MIENSSFEKGRIESGVIAEKQKPKISLFLFCFILYSEFLLLFFKPSRELLAYVYE